MKADFLARVEQGLVGGTNVRAAQRDFWVKSLEQPKVAAQLRQSAKATYLSQQASQKPSTWGTRISNSFNAVAAGLLLLHQIKRYSLTLSTALGTYSYAITTITITTNVTISLFLLLSTLKRQLP